MRRSFRRRICLESAFRENRFGRFLSSISLVGVVFLLLTGNCNAQSVSSYVFASAYTGSSLVDQDARNNLDSFEQANATAVADRIACSMTKFVRITDAVGLYDTSAENSFMVRTSLGQADSEYLASLLARYAHQKFALLFLARQGAADRLWIVRTDKPWETVAALARQSGVVPLTMASEGTTNLYAVDFGAKLEARFRALISGLHADSETVEGKAETLGDADLSKASALFEQKIKSAERADRKRLSLNLWTERWHDATSRTCSVAAR